MAEDLGKRLLGEIEEVGLDEILQTIRLHDDTTPASYFGLTQLDRWLHIITEARPSPTKTKPTPPIIEFTSPASGGGKTHLLYHVTALATLPTQNGGKQACAIILDSDNSFSVARLAQHISLLLTRSTTAADAPPPADVNNDTTIASALKHTHIFRPQTLPSTLATLASLPTYLFNRSKHHSFDRRVAFIALDSASAFYWQHRADEDSAALLHTTSTSTSTTTTTASSKSSGYASLTTALKHASTTFSSPILLTSRSLSPAPNTTPLSANNSAEAHSLRPCLPSPLSQLPTLRLILQRIPVRKFPAGISLEEAQRKAPARQQAVEEGRFEALVNEWGVDERTLQKLQQRQGTGFGFSITNNGGVTFIEER